MGVSKAWLPKPKAKAWDDSHCRLVDKDGEIIYEKQDADKKVKLCVYGTLKMGFPADINKKDKVWFEGTTYVPYYEMVSLGSFPGVLWSDKSNKSIFAEVYSIADSLLPELDAYEGVPGFYIRTKVHTVYGEAFMYILPALDKYTSLPKIPSGRWENK